MSIAGVLAKARERGVEPEHEELVEKAMRLVNENAKINTEFHYSLVCPCIKSKMQACCTNHRPGSSSIAISPSVLCLKATI